MMRALVSEGERVAQNRWSGDRQEAREVLELTFECELASQLDIFYCRQDSFI
jgi:hypothetical protein